MSLSSNNKVYIADYLGVIPYELALKQQQILVQARAEGKIPDALLLLQHDPVFTTGRFRGEEDIVVSIESLEKEGIAVFASNRGGSVTYHGPGQLVGYPILNLENFGLGVKQYIHKLEDAIILTLADYGINAGRLEGATGVWIDNNLNQNTKPEIRNLRKICAIGVRVSRYVTMHGFALNVNTDLRYFSYINPCGLTFGVTSIRQEMGKECSMEEVKEILKRKFNELY